MRKYYKAYEERYKTVHEQTGKSWAGDEASVVLDDMLKRHGALNSSRILELGCGEGQNAMFLLGKGYNVFASDVSSEAIRWCWQKAQKCGFPQERFFVLDVLDNNLPEKYDYIVTISTLHMLVLDEDRKKFLDFIYSHLNEGGKAIITVMGDGIMVRDDCDITKAYELAERNFGNKKIKVATTSCKIVNWQTFIKELTNSSLKIVENFVSEDISGFNKSMVAIVKR